jgi:hypothetical protein
MRQLIRRIAAAATITAAVTAGLTTPASAAPSSGFDNWS